MSTEKPINPSKVQSEPHLPSDVVLGQLVTERIGLESGIVLSFSSKPQRRVRCCSLTAGYWSQHPQPHRGGSTVGGGLSRYWTGTLSPRLSGLALLPESQLAIVYHFISFSIIHFLHLTPSFSSGALLARKRMYSYGKYIPRRHIPCQKKEQN